MQKWEDPIKNRMNKNPERNLKVGLASLPRKKGRSFFCLVFFLNLQSATKLLTH